MAKFFSRLKDSSGANPPSEPSENAHPSEPVDRAPRPQSFLRRLPPALLRPFSGSKPLYRRPLFWLSLVAGGGTIALGIGWYELDRSLPTNLDDVLTYVRPNTLTIKASDGTILQQIGPATREKLPLTQIPKRLQEAFISIEDRRFYQHKGVDFQGIGRALFSNVQAGDVVEGGSTITQQLTRVVFLDQERSIWRKLREMRLAQKVEEKTSKDQILERYLNLVYLGEGAYGVADAAWVYFGKTVNQLTLPEMATLAGIPPAPVEYSPLKNPDLIKQRRNLVLDRMQEAGYITEAEAQSAKEAALTTNAQRPKRLDRLAPYFTEYVQLELPKYVKPELIKAGGLTVETSLQPQWQKSAEEAVEKSIDRYSRGQNFDQAALVAIDPRNGEIRAMVGGKDFFKQQFNRVTQAQRQPGSTFKAFVYTTAIAAGFSPFRGYLDAPLTVDGYTPKNYNEESFRGWINMRDALTQSTNVVAVKVLMDVGYQPLIDVTRKMGVESKLESNLSMALGSFEVNLLELTSAYGTFANQGLHVKPHGIRRVFDSRGNLIYQADFKGERAIEKDTAAIMTWMLRSVVNSGTGRAAQIDRPVAGKTGTSDQARDLWFIGYIPQVVAGVWLGNDDNDPTWGASSTAALTWNNFMEKVVEGMPVEQFPPRPDQVEGRKAQIKVEPVRARRVVVGKIPDRDEETAETTTSSRSSRRRRDRTEVNQSQPTETPRRRRRRRVAVNSTAPNPGVAPSSNSSEETPRRRRRRRTETAAPSEPTVTRRSRPVAEPAAEPRQRSVPVAEPPAPPAGRREVSPEVVAPLAPPASRREE